MARILIGAYAVRLPLGGYVSWNLQWLLGFARLGHEVYLVEKSGWPSSCYDPSTRTHGDDCAHGLAVVHQALDRFGLGSHWCYVDAGGRYHGRSRKHIEDVFASADLFIDLTSHGTFVPGIGIEGTWLGEAARTAVTVLVDGEPGWTQMRMQKALEAGDPVPEFHHYYTVGQNVGTAGCTAPAAGRAWRHVFDPVVLDLFTPGSSPAGAPFTTVMSWQAHAATTFNGITYGQKDVEFSRFLSLPGRVTVPLEVAVGGPDVPTATLSASGWRLRDAQEVTASFDQWRDYIRSSRGEFSVCKNIFVATHSGFFSDRSAVYLASGRPVVLQDTGFSAHLPCGEGLFAVKTIDEARDAIQQIEADYDRHARRALAIAERFLDARIVLAGLLRDVGLG